MSIPLLTHIADHPYIRAVEHALAADPDATGDEAFWGRTADLMHRGAEDSHRAAAMIMHEYQVTKRPFGLYLRGFEAESYLYFSADVVPGRDGGTVTTTLSGPSSVETRLTRALGDLLPMIAIANPAQLMTSRGIVPRLQLPNEGWQQAVQNLIEHAHLIVMDCDALAPGVAWELETISALERADRTIIILPARGAGATDNNMHGIVEALGAAVQRREPVTKSDFGPWRAAYEDEVDFDLIDQSPLFAALLADAVDKSARTPPFDAHAYGRMLNNDAVALMEKQQFVEAFALHTQALLVRRQINDRDGLLMTLRNLGIVCTDAEQYAQALPYFGEALKLARELERVKDLGDIAAYKGFAHRKLGHRDEAVMWLRAGYALQAATGSQSEMESTLLHLADMHREAGEGDEVLQCYGLLRQHWQTSGDR